MSVTLARQIVTALHFPLDQLCIYQKAVVSMNKIVFVKKLLLVEMDTGPV